MSLPKLTTHAIEQSTYPVIVNLVDHNDDPITPNDDVTWSLVDGANEVVNAREDVEYTPPDNTLTIVLSGDDLAMLTANEEEKRYVVVECTYNSVTYGDDLPFKGQVEFTIDGLKKVS